MPIYGTAIDQPGGRDGYEFMTHLHQALRLFNDFLNALSPVEMPSFMRVVSFAESVLSSCIKYFQPSIKKSMTHTDESFHRQDAHRDDGISDNRNRMRIVIETSQSGLAFAFLPIGGHRR